MNNCAIAAQTSAAVAADCAAGYENLLCHEQNDHSGLTDREHLK
jgi:hypothetical protein